MALSARLLQQLGASLPPRVLFAAYLGTLALLLGLGLTVGNDSLPVAGLVVFLAALFVAVVLRTRPDIRAIRARQADDDG